MNDAPVLIDIDLIVANPFQVRQAEDPVAVSELAANIEKNGLLQPPTVRFWKDVALAAFDPKQNVPQAIREEGLGYELAFGHTRLAAFKLLAFGKYNLTGQGKKEFKQIPCFIRKLEDLQMFEMAVAENIKRRDLNPIERARAMQTYMDKFKKTSVETGEFFACDEATVRGTVRLLGLPEVAQAKLSSGEITVGTARQLLTLEKVAPEQMVGALQEILEGNEPAADIIQDALQESDETQQMYQYSGDHKNPTAGNGLWELNMKKFPNNLLPKLTSEDAAIALGIQDDEASMSVINVWLGSGLEGDLTALGLTPDLVERLNRLLNPPACTACPVYVQVDYEHFCGSRICLQRKSAAWWQYSLEKESKKLDIPIYSEADGDRLIISYDQEKDWEEHDKGLRLILKQDIPSDRNYYSQYFTHLPNNILAVLTGETFQKIKEKKTKERRATLDMNKDARRAEKAFEHTKKDRALLVWDATQAFQELFIRMPKRVIDALLEDVHSGYSFLRTPAGAISDGTELTTRRLLGLHLIHETLQDIMCDNVTTMAKAILELANECTLTTLPTDWLERARSIEPELIVAAETDDESEEDE